MLRTVVITGIGVTTPLGGDLDSTWAGLLQGRSGVRAIQHDWANQLPARIAAEVVVEPTDKLDRVAARRMDRASQLGVVAATEAWADAGFDAEPALDHSRVAVSVGTGIGGLRTLIANWDVLQEKGVRRVSPFAIPMLMANAAAANVGLRVGARGGVHTPVSACASGSEAISQGLDLIRLNRADVVVVGGAEGVVHPLPLAAFAQMQALSRRNEEPERASRPWDVDRDGFVLGEGAAILVLESLDHATARGAKIWGTLAGSGITADCHDMVQPDPHGLGQATAMSKALIDAELTGTDIIHVNAHATSTPAGDPTEAVSIRAALGEDTTAIVNGTKSMTAHLLGAAGALESAVTIKTLLHRVIPPTINLENPEPGLGIDIATTVRELPAGDLAAINNSFGFGGHNVALVFTNAHANRES